MAAITTGLILGGIGGLGKLYGSWQAGREAKRGREAYEGTMQDVLGGMREDVAGQREDIARYLEPDAHRDYMQTAQAQSMMEASRGQLQDMARQIRGGVARTGGTPEAAIAGQTAATRGYADIINRLAGHGTQYRQQAQGRLMGALQGWRGAQAGVHAAEGGMAGELLGMSQQQAQQHAQSGQGWLEALLGLAGTMGTPTSN